MHNWLTGIHLTFAALWIGCVLTEALFERALLAGDRASHLLLARLHARVDLLVEIPAFTGVLLTGIILSTQTHSGSIAIKIMMLCGLCAIITNVHTVSGWCFSAAAPLSRPIGQDSTGSITCNTSSVRLCCCLRWRH